jgi:catechol 2,3-dioxygenase-like lactoylglutathione lyase family enzyme
MPSSPRKNVPPLSSRAKRGICFCIIFSLLLLVSSSAQNPPIRPSITGLAKVRILTSAPPDADRLYLRVFKLASVPTSFCDDVSLSCLGLNDHQFLSFFPSYHEEDNSRLSEITFETTDVEQLRNYLDAAGVKTYDIQAPKSGSRHFGARDPEGHRIGFIQYSARPELNNPANQLSVRLIHAGFVVHDRAAEDHFYKDILGFRPYWHGGMKDDKDDWVAMQVPDGTDWVEYMLNISPTADKHTLGVMNHIALGVTDIHAAEAQLRKNGWSGSDQPKMGRDGKWQLNLYDPDDTRIEFMEFTPKEKPCCSEFTGPHPGPKQ